MTTLADALRDVPVVGILRGCLPDNVVGVAKAAVTAGFRAVEVTMDSPDACGQIAALRSALGEDVAVGAGTITSTAELDAARDAGAVFGVAPDLQVEIVARAVDADFAFVPGAMTPTEIAAAYRAGAAFVKVFPSVVLGPAFVRALRGPFPSVPLLCTGGVEPELARELLDAGADAVGVSGDVFSSGAMRAGDTATIAAGAERFLHVACGR